MLTPQLKQQFEQTHARVSQEQGVDLHVKLFPKAMALERAFARAGGLLVAGTDPTGSGGVIPGYANQRQIELLVEAGFTPLEAISIGTLNGARYLGRDASIGTHCRRQAGRPGGRQRRSVGDIADVRKVEIVFRQGVGLRPGEADRLGQRPRRLVLMRTGSVDSAEAQDVQTHL